ncbi:minor capsid protein [Clostridium botulinum]|uniref:Capsid protein n=1 Tax=Clostridium botulinum TaxID=1491 RepID=A0A6G4EDB6_CLOBO|nr:minor capsid protein [Clostridium botulinum]AUM91510.1 capsid protein [Clostridium botulinum]NFB12908.1 capsid protein [Clostridium botulinum]NFH57838.1 capsid protein [Clostridium botulinum]NFH61199.1 capsid protein [Clostridium botulinum]NFJ87289.1 capsid protein [Clostridium botulinum]
MSTKVRVQIDNPQKILLKRYLNKDGQAQVKFTKEVAKKSNNYVPFLTGRLKDMSVQLTTNKIIWNAPYSKKQYYLNKGGNRGALRGKYWDKRMWGNEGDEIVQSIAKFCGGRSK